MNTSDLEAFLAHLREFMTDPGRIHGDRVTLVDARIRDGDIVSVLYREQPGGPILGWRRQLSEIDSTFGSDVDEKGLAWEFFSNEIADPTGVSTAWLTEKDELTGLTVTWVGTPSSSSETPPESN